MVFFFKNQNQHGKFPDGNKHANSVPQKIRCFSLSPYRTMQTKQFQEFFLSILDFSNLDASSLLHSHSCSDALMLVLGMVHLAGAVLVLDHGGFDVSMSLHGLASLELVTLVSRRQRSFSGGSLNYPFWQGTKNVKKSMIRLGDFRLIRLGDFRFLMVHYLGWLYSDPCLFETGPIYGF